ncbi:hypothetical protein PAXRUDRAFT_15861 [Paxillus rubicundulus Ve08.2h10]|uniref:Uncharacterized protein n=1 Tax=Paxillus rubicundulus Ve08.2h10 TaxID=930991 RepID=A0A0D0DNP8_9AGAM|nr:hypothetical protein PAXRUDRAFT_15861 [Paxillus rubicundulus Ve08.2h10]
MQPSGRTKSGIASTAAGSLIKGPRTTPASTTYSSTCPSTPASSALTLELHEPTSYLAANDKLECEVINSSAKASVRQRTAALDIVEVISGSEEEAFPPPPILLLSHSRPQKQAVKTNPVIVLEDAEPTVLIDEDVPQVKTSGRGLKRLQTYAKQNLCIWRTGFAAAAVTVITALFINDSSFEDSEQHAQFATAMLKKNRFLFEQN